MRENLLFLNIYDFWCLKHSGFMLGTYEHKVVKLERVIRKKWKRVKDLPVINVLIRKLKEGDEAFNPTDSLEGVQEQFFQILQQWKKDFEKTYLEQYSLLPQPIRYKKLYIKPSWVKRIIFYFLY